MPTVRLLKNARVAGVTPDVDVGQMDRCACDATAARTSSFRGGLPVAQNASHPTRIS